MSASIWTPSGFLNVLSSLFISFTQQGAGAIVQTVGGKLQQVKHVKDFGVVGDGVVDDLAKLQVAIASGYSLDWTDTTCRITDTLNVTTRQIWGGKNSSIVLDRTGTTIRPAVNFLPGTDNSEIFGITFDQAAGGIAQPSLANQTAFAYLGAVLVQGNNISFTGCKVQNSWDNGFGVIRLAITGDGSGGAPFSSTQTNGLPEGVIFTNCRASNCGIGEHNGAFGEFGKKGLGFNNLTGTRTIFDTCFVEDSYNGFGTDFGGGGQAIFSSCVATNILKDLTYPINGSGIGYYWADGPNQVEGCKAYFCQRYAMVISEYSQSFSGTGLLCYVSEEEGLIIEASNVNISELTLDTCCNAATDTYDAVRISSGAGALSNIFLDNVRTRGTKQRYVLGCDGANSIRASVYLGPVSAVRGNIFASAAASHFVSAIDTQVAISADARGAKGDNSTNNTAILQAAILAAEAVSGVLELGEGTYLHDGLTVSSNILIKGKDQAKTILKLRNGINGNNITIDPNVVQNPTFEKLTIDGNRANNTTGNGIHLANSGLSYGFSVVLRDVYLQNIADDCLYVGTNRNMGYASNVEFKRGDRCIYIQDSSDWRFESCRVAFPQVSHALQVDSGADNLFKGTSFYGATGAAAIKLASVASSPTKFETCTINDNDRGAVWIKGFTGAARHIAHKFIGCWFAENSKSINGGYPHILCEDTSGTVLIGNSFRYTGSGNKPSYLVEFAGTTLPIVWEGNSYDAAVNVPYVTAVTNSSANLRALAQSLRVLGVSSLGGDAGAESLLVAQGVAGGNNITVTGRASGTGPDLQSTGADTDIALRISSKGAGNVEVWTGGLARRIARFMNVASSVNRLDFYPSATGAAVRVVADGTDSNISLSLEPKGTGQMIVPIGNVPAYADDTAAAAGGVPVGGFYRTASGLKIRVT